MAFWEKPTEVKAEAPKTKKIDDTEWQDLLLNVDETESNVETQDVEILEKIQKIENQINKEWNKIPEWLKEKYIKIKNWIMAKSTELFNKYLEEKGEKVDSNDGEGVVNIDYYFNNRNAAETLANNYLVGEPNTIDGIKNKIRIIKEKGSEKLKKEFDAEMKKFLDDAVNPLYNDLFQDVVKTEDTVEWWKSPTTSPSGPAEWWYGSNMAGLWQEADLWWGDEI